MDEGLSKAVTEFFVRLYDKGLIYRGNRMINWCSECGTTLSDAEVEHEDQEGKYWYYRYPTADGGEGITVATARPETMFGDVAIAVNPEDERYSHMIGKIVILPIVGREIPVIADPYPDPDKGTGAVKITPAHDLNDYEVGERHGLETIQCIDFDAKMNEAAGKYKGLDRYECRKQWAKELEQGGFLVKTEKITIPTGRCYRCNDDVEPMISEQWFVKMEGLAKPALEANLKGDIKCVPERFDKVYQHWLETIRDWCISRQLWWGHRIPAYYCSKCGKTVVATEEPKTCPKCGNDKFAQDEDVLDTWFSSGLWPFSTLGWPEKTKDLDYFFPTDVLSHGYEILFFWVIRMVVSSLEIMGRLPFHTVLIHGLVRAEDGVKMSKSLDNGVDPIEVIDGYGADALRFFLLDGSAAGNDMRFIMKNVESTRNFANKLWNASRFVLMNLEDTDIDAPGGAQGTASKKTEIDPDAERTYSGKPENDLDAEKYSGSAELKDEDKWMILKTKETASEISRNMDQYDFSVATAKIYELIWNEYCDWYIEFVKPRLYGEDEDDKLCCKKVLTDVLSDLLRLLHPFMPFITEHIWGFLGKPEMLIADHWPEIDVESFAEYRFAYEKVELAKSVVRAVRNIRAETEAQPGKKLPLYAVTDDAEKAGKLSQAQNLIITTAGLSSIKAIEQKNAADYEDIINGECATSVVEGFTLYVPLDELVDYKAEKERLEKERIRLEGEIERVSAKLKNEAFVNKAPEKVVGFEREKLEKSKDSYAKILARIDAIKNK